MSDVPTPEQVEQAIHLLAANADRMEQVARNLMQLRERVTPESAVSVTDTDKLKLAGYAITADNGHHQLKLKKGGEDVEVVINTPDNYLRLVQDGHRLADQDIQRIDNALGEAGVLAHKMHLDFNIHNDQPPLSFRRYYDRPEQQKDEQALLSNLGQALADAAGIMNNAQGFAGEAPLTSAEREQCRRDGEFAAQHQADMGAAGALLARHNAITDIEGERKRNLYAKVKDHAHRPQAEEVYRASKFEQGIQLLGESQQNAAEDPSYRERIGRRRPLNVINDDPTPRER